MSCTTPEPSSTCKRLWPALLLALVSGQSLAAAETSAGAAPVSPRQAADTTAASNSMASALLPAVL